MKRHHQTAVMLAQVFDGSAVGEWDRDQALARIALLASTVDVVIVVTSQASLSYLRETYITDVLRLPKPEWSEIGYAEASVLDCRTRQETFVRRDDG